MASTSMCINCGLKPKFVDSTRTHDFCGRGCANAYNQSGGAGGGYGGFAGTTHSNMQAPTQQQQHLPPQQQQYQPYPSPPVNPYMPPPPVFSSGPMCLYPGCNKPPFQLGADYCSRTHRDQGNAQGLTPQKPAYQTGVPAYGFSPIPAPAFGGYSPQPPPPPPPPPPLDPAKACLLCKTKPKNGKEHFCGKTCADNATNAAPMLLHIPKGHDSFNDVVNQLKKSWRHTNKPIPTVHYVYKIVGTKKSITAYDTYRAQVESRGHFTSRGMSEGNERRRWHGTTRTCNLGDNPANLAFCGSTTCSLCSILQTSFRLAAFGKQTGWGRFGAGIYTSSTSSKSNDYSKGPKSSPYTAIILTRVVVGRGQKITQDSTTLTGPAQGYDSVLGEVGAGGNLNYDELVVYRDDAVRPSYLVLYK